MGKCCYYISPRPVLSIERRRGSTFSRGPSYGGSGYTITSTRRLDKDQLMKLWDAGLLGSGQAFYINSQCDGMEKAAGSDMVEGVMIDDYGNRLDEPPTLWNGAPAPPDTVPYYVYHTHYVCDSGD
jgi:hypothetical protein